ncbi:MAG: secretin N-terminal domain-containing protein [Planctomycetota bacterium]
MTRQNLQRGWNGAVLSVVVAMLWCGWALAQDKPPAQTQPARPPARGVQPKSPTTQPVDDAELQEKFIHLLEERDKAESPRQPKRKSPAPSDGKTLEPPAKPEAPVPEAPVPESKPGTVESTTGRRSLEELRRNAHTSTQGAEPPASRPVSVVLAEEDDVDEFGPPYPPATPARTPRVSIPERRPALEEEQAEAAERGQPASSEPPVSNATGEGEWFNFVNMPWEDVIMYFVERIGKPLFVEGGDLMIGGELTYVSEREFTKEEAIDELNLIMHMRGYRFIEAEHHIFVVPLNEVVWYIEQTFETLEKFEQADLRPTDYVRLFVQVPDQPVKKIQLMFENMVPDYMTVMGIEDSNQLKLEGLVQDINKILALMERVKIDEDDPRETRIFNIETNARDIERMVRDILGISSSTRMTAVQIDPRTRRPVATPSLEDADTNVRMSADDRTNTLIVRAMPAKLVEIEELIKQIDIKPDIDFYTVVTEIVNANAADVEELLTKIFSQEQGQQTPSWQRQQALQRAQQARSRSRQTPARRTPQQPAGATPEDLLGEGLFERAKKTIRLAADERTNSLVVYANEDGHKRVADLLKEIDKAEPGNFQTIKVEHADAEQIFGTLNEIVASMTLSGSRGRAPSIVLDEDNNQFHVIAEREQMKQITDVVTELDIEMPEPERHVIRLTNLIPSQVAQMIQPILMDSGGSRAPAVSRLRGRSSRRGGGAAGGSTSNDVQIIPLDDAGILIVVCSEDAWAKVEDTIKLWDENAVSSTPSLETFEITAGDAQAIADTLNGMYRGTYTHPIFGRAPLVIQPEGSSILVYSIKPAIEEVTPLIAALDRADGSRTEILPLAHADVNIVAQHLQQLFVSGGGGGGRFPRGGGGGGGVYIQPETVTNSLIVQADEITLAKIKDFAMDMDQRQGAQEPERAYYTLENAAPRDVVNAINSLFGATGGGGGRFRGQAVGTQVKVVIVGNQVVVDAPAEKQQEVAALVQQLDDLSDQGITTLLVKMPGANVRSIAGKLTSAFNDRVQQQGVVARFEADDATESILVTVSKDVTEEANQLLEEYRAISEGLINQTEFYQLQHAGANEVASWLRNELVTMMTKQFGRSAAQQVTVTPEPRTNRIIISAPQVAVTAAMPLLEQYDVPPKELAVNILVETVTRKLPGLDVANLANQLNQAFQDINRQRADKLRTVFGYDRLTEMLIVTTPTDTKSRVDELIAQFVSETEGMAPEQKFIDILKADANYIADQVRQIMNVRIAGTRGREVAGRVNIQVDTRLNRVIVNAPQFAIEMAEALIAELDQEPTTETQLQTISLENADANAVYNVLRTIFQEKIRARTLQISVETLTNALIVGGTKEDFEDIEQWARQLDEKAAEKISAPKIFDLENANPWEVNTILQQTYVQKGYGRTVPPSKQIKISIVGGRSLVVQAPPEKLAEIEALIKKLDEMLSNQTIVRTYKLPGLGPELNSLARDIGNAINQGRQARERPVNITTLPQADTLIVSAMEDQFAKVEQFMEQFKDLYTPPKIETIALQHGDANMVYQALSRVLQPKIRAGKMTISVESMTNSLVVSAAEEDLAEIRDWSAKLDEAAKQMVSLPKIIELKNANPWEVRGILDVTFVPPGRGRVQAGKEVRFDIVGGRSIVVKAPADQMEDIEALIAQLDEVGELKVQVRTYELRGMGNRLDDLARQITTAVNAGITGREQRINVTTYPPADALIVTALEHQFAQVEQMMEQFKPLMEVAKFDTEFFTLKYVDAGQIAGTVQNLVQTKIRASGRPSRGAQEFSVSADPRTNRLIVFAPESMLPDVRTVVQELDIEVNEDNIVTIELKYADPWETRNMINDVFGSRGRRQGQSLTEEVYVTVNNNTLIVKAPPKKLEQITELIAKVDAEDSGGLQIKTYDLKVLNATMVAAQVQMYLRSVGGVGRRGQMQPGAFGEPTTNTLVVIAPPQHLPFIETLISQMEAKTPDEAISRTYTLKYARAEQVQRHVDQMLRVKVAEREGTVRGRAVQDRTAVMADTATNRLFVFAPEEYQELAAELVRMVDEEVDTGEIVHIIPLEQADAQQLAQTLQQLVQQSGRGGRGATPGREVRITSDAGSNSILLAGLPKDVAEVEEHIKVLEINSVLIPELQIFKLKNANALDVATTLEGIFGGVGRGRGRGNQGMDTVSITPDEYYNRLLVTANKRKMREVEGFIEQLDAEIPVGEGLTDSSGRELFFVDVYRGDPFDIAWEVRDMVPPVEKGGPMIDADWFGEYIKVKCRPSEYDQIVGLIREFEKRARVEKKVITRQLKGDPDAILAYLRERMDEDELIIERPTDRPRPATIVETLWEDDEEPPSVKEKRERQQRERSEKTEPKDAPRADARPFRLGMPVTVALLGDDADLLFDDEPPASQTPVKKAAAEPLEPKTSQPTASPTSRPAEDDVPRKEKTRVVVQPDNTIVIYGPEDDVNEVKDILDLLEEDLAVGEVIRIFKFKYGDVSAAAEVINIMFNERQTIQLPQQQQPQRGRQPDRQGEQGRDQQSMMEQMRGMMGGRQTDQRGRRTGGQRVRIATDPSHNYLIIKCEEVDLPEIKQLLRELDIPPGEVELKVFQLRNLDATETANNIKDILGINKAQSRRGGMPMRGAARGGANPQQALMEMLQQQMVSVPGVEGGAKVEQVEVVPNAVTNSLMVSAPPEVMKIIENIISELEDLEGYDVVGVYHYKLEQAKVDEILPLLQEIFAAAAGGGGGPRRGGGGTHGALGPVTMSGDPRVNTIIFTAQAKDVEIVEAQIRMLDIEGPIADAELYVCQYGDAQAIADVVEAIFVQGGGQGGRPGRGSVQQMTGQEVRIVAESTTNTIVVWGPPDKRDVIFAKIAELDDSSKRAIREIDVIYADPEKLAETLLQMFGGAGGSAAGGRPGGRRGGARQTTGSAGIVIIGDKNAMKLMVRAPEPIFLQIEEVVATLDQEIQQIKIRRFALKYADAEGVVDSLKSALTEYLQMDQMSGGGDMPFDPFTVVPDARTNSVMVVGSEQTFAFVESILTTIDVETPAEQRKDFRVFVLDKADAETVAQAINDFAAGGGMGGTQGRQQSSGGRRGSRGMGATTGLGHQLDVFATSEPSSNTVMVAGKSEHIDIIEDEIINQLEDKIRTKYRIDTIVVKNAKPTEIVSFIGQFLSDTDVQTTGGGPGRRGRGGSQQGLPGPRMIPNDNNNTIVVRGSDADILEVRDLVERFDDKSLLTHNIAVVKVPIGQDLNSLATEIERMINESEQSVAERTGRVAGQIVIAPNEFTNTLMVSGDPTLFGMVTSLVDELGGIRRDNVVTRVINLGNLSSDDAKQLIEDLQNRSGSSGRSSTPRRGTNIRRTGGANRRPGGRGDANWPHMREIQETPWRAAPLAWASPYVSTAVLRSAMVNVIVDTLLEDDDPPAKQQPPAQKEEPRRQPTRRGDEPARAFGPSRSEIGSALEDTPPPPADPVPGLTGITGELRGEVTVSEIDSKRIIVTGDESDVGFIEQILLMMEMSASPAVIHVFTIQNAKATALAPIIETAIQAKIDVRTQTPGPEDRFSISAEGRSNSLIVSASETLMVDIEALVAQLDVERAEGDTDFRVVALSHVRASDAVAKLRPILEKLNNQREVPRESQATIEPDDRSNSVFIVGTPNDVKDIEKMLVAYDVEITDDEDKTSFVRADAILIQLKNGDAEDIARVLTEMIEAEQEAAREAQRGGDRAAAPYVSIIRLRMPNGRELPELNLERPIRIIPEKGTNSLIIFSTLENNESLTEIVGVFDTLPIGAETELRAIALQYASAEDIAEVLDKVFDEGKKALARPSEGDSSGLEKGKLPPVPPGVTGKGLPYPLVVQHDVRSNTIIVIGRKEAVLLAAGLVAELDRPSVELAGTPRIIELKNYQATLLAEKLKEMLDDRADALGADKNAARDSAVIMPDDRSNTLVVLASPELFEMVEEVALQLDAAENYSPVDVHYRRLEHADAQKLQGLVQELFERKQEAQTKQSDESKDTLHVIADARSNSLMMTGTRDYLTEANELIDKLDQSFDPTVVFVVRPIKLNSAANIATLLQDMVEKALSEQDSNLKGTPIHIAADPLSDSLLLAASQEDMTMLLRWVEILDRPTDFVRMIKIIPLKNRSAEEVAQAAEDIFGDAGGSEIDVAIAHDVSTNSVVAFAPPALLADIVDFVRQIDETESGSEAIVRIVKLTQADAEDASDLLNNILGLEGGSVGGSRGGGGGGRANDEVEKQRVLIFQAAHAELGVETLKGLRNEITVTGDLRTNSLIIMAPPKSMALMESLVAAIDVPPDANKIRRYKLRNADAEQMVEMLNQLFEQEQAGGGRTSGDETQRELTLGGIVGGGRQEVSFTTDVRTNSVIAAGTPGYLDLVEELILELDKEPIDERKTYVYSPRNMVATDLADTIRSYSDEEKALLDQLGDEISLSRRQEREIVAIANEEANRIVMSYSPRFENEVMDIVHRLDQPPPQVSIEVLIVEVVMDNSLELGVEFAFQDLQWTKAGTQDTTTFDFVGGTDVGAAGAGLGGFTFTITGRDFNFLLRTLQSEGSLNVLSRPHIVAMDNQLASIEVTDSVPFVTGSATTIGGSVQTQVSRENVGIKLEVTPQINPDGFVRLEIRQEVSDLSESTIAIGPGLTAPIFLKRIAETVVTVQDNETVVLGGLIQTRDNQTEQKIPIMGDIPVLGPLFRYQNDSQRRSELLVILTPRVIRTVEDYREVSLQERDQTGLIPDEVKLNPLMRGLQVRPEELVPIDDSKLFGPYEESTPADEPSRPGKEQYGPERPIGMPVPRREKESDLNSYDIPISMLTRRG